VKLQELTLEGGLWISKSQAVLDSSSVQLILLFGDIDAISDTTHAEYLQSLYPNAKIVGASTAGNIESGTFSESLIVATLVAFEKGWIEVVSTDSLDNDVLPERSAELINRLSREHLRHVFVLMDGLKLNGSLFLQGANSVLGEVTMTGAMAGDGNIFHHTMVLCNGIAKENSVVAIGFYGETLHVSIGCETGWEEFGAERIVTRSEGNVVYEIDNKPALKLYEDYLGDFIKDLPASGLRFPLNIRRYAGEKEVIRVIMAINEDKSLVFVGDIPQGSKVRLMKTNVNNLIEGADLAAQSVHPFNDQPSLAIVISCSGRLSVLKQMVDEELLSVSERLGGNTHICGMYSYGELSPFSDTPIDCKLHNQTMALTVIYEE